MSDRHLQSVIDEVREALDAAAKSLRLASPESVPSELSDAKQVLWSLEHLLPAVDSLAEVHATLRQTTPEEISRFPQLVRRLSRITVTALEQIQPVLEWSKQDIEEADEMLSFASDLARDLIKPSNESKGTDNA